MKEFKNLLFENQDGLGILTMNRPAALNALNKETMDELCELLTAIKNDPSIKVVILTGAEKSFVAGADIKEMLPMTASIRFSTRKMPPVMTGAQKKPPRFSQNSRFSSHVNAPGLEDLPNVEVTAFMRRFLS